MTPLPEVALSLSADQSKLLLTIPGIPGKSRPHSLEVPMNEKGMGTIVKVLKARFIAVQEAATIGTDASPIQAIIDEWLKAGNSVEDEGERSKRQMEEKYGEGFMDKLKGLKINL